MIPYYITDLIEAWEPVGSRVTCNPPPMDTDQDILVLADKKEYSTLKQELQLNKWTYQDGRGPAPKEPLFDPNDEASMKVFKQWIKDHKAWENSEGYEDIGTYGGRETSFNSWRLEELNLIITFKEDWYSQFLLATQSCKEKNLLLKSERLAEFEKFFPKAGKPKKQKRKNSIKGKSPMQMLIDDLSTVDVTSQTVNQQAGYGLEGAQTQLAAMQNQIQPPVWYNNPYQANLSPTTYTPIWQTISSSTGSF